MKLATTIMVMLCQLLFCNGAMAEIRQPLTINAATVYLSGASLVSTARLELAKGEQDVLFTNIPAALNASSIMINTTNDVVVEATTFQSDCTVAAPLSRRYMQINDSLDRLADLRIPIDTKMSVVKEQLEVLQHHKKLINENTGLAVAELSKLLDLVGTHMTTYLNEQNRLQALLDKLDERTEDLKQEQSDERKSGIVAGGQLLVRFYTRDQVNTLVTVSYAIPNAGWSPTYDIMADVVNGPVKLYYKANVYQNSGIKWDKIQLTLSTGNPSESILPPVVVPWYLSLYVAPPSYTPQPTSYAPVQNNYGNVQNNYGTTVLDRNAINQLPTQQITDAVSTSKGVYQSKRGSDVNIAGGRTSGTLYIVDGVQVLGASSMTNYTSVSNSGINAAFDIDLPYSIPSDGQQHLVTMKKYELPATYRYYAAPKIDKDAFLQAQITNWEDMNLLAGPTNIYYEKAYVGQGYININNPDDTMLLSLGRDKKVIIKRERDKTMHNAKPSGATIREVYAYTISIRNTRKEKINLVLQDQAPISKDNEVVVEDINSGGSNYSDSTGLMSWALTPLPNETRKLNMGFTVKYPKGKYIVGLR